MTIYDVTLTSDDLDALTKSVVGSGGRQSLLRRLQASVRYVGTNEAVLRISDADVERCARQWVNTGAEPGVGGFQSRIPMESLANYGLAPQRIYRRPKSAEQAGLF